MSSEHNSSWVFREPSDIRLQPWLFDRCKQSNFAKIFNESFIVAAQKVDTNSCKWTQVRERILSENLQTFLATDGQFKIACAFKCIDLENDFDSDHIHLFWIHSAVICPFSKDSEFDVLLHVHTFSQLPITELDVVLYKLAFNQSAFISKNAQVRLEIDNYMKIRSAPCVKEIVDKALEGCETDLSKLIALMPISGLGCIDPPITSTYKSHSPTGDVNIQIDDFTQCRKRDEQSSIEIEILGGDGRPIKRFCDQSQTPWQDIEAPDSVPFVELYVRSVRVQTNSKLLGWKDGMPLSCQVESQPLSCINGNACFKVAPFLCHFSLNEMMRKLCVESVLNT